MNKAYPFLIAGLIALAGCDRPVEESPLAGASIGGPFVLTGENGQRVDSRSFDGKYRLIYFGYTFCPDVCPTDIARLMKGYQKFEQDDAARAARVVPIFITVDPQRDTPEVLRQWTDSFDPHLIGLTGSEAEIAAVTKQFAVYSRREAANKDGGYLVDHARMALLMGPKGEPIALIPQDRDPATIAAELDRWVR